MTPYRSPGLDGETSKPPSRELGDLRSTHRLGPASRMPLVAGLALSGIVAGLGVAQKNPLLVVIALTVAVATALLGGLAEWSLGLGATVDLYDEGLVVRRSWTESAALLFEDVDAVFYDFEVTRRFGMRMAPTAKVTLVSHEGRRITLPRGLTDMLAIVRAVDRKVVRPLLAPAKRALTEGHELLFGPVILDREGVRIGGEHLAWDDVDAVDAQPDELTFASRRRGRFHARVREIPHPRILVVLLRTKTAVHGPRGFWGE